MFVWLITASEYSTADEEIDEWLHKKNDKINEVRQTLFN